MMHILNAEETGRLPSHYHKCVTELLNVRTAATKLQIFAQVCKSSPTHARNLESACILFHSVCGRLLQSEQREVYLERGARCN